MDDVKTKDFMTKIYSEMLSGFKRIDERFEQMDGRIGQMDGQIGLLAGQIGQMDGQLSRVEGGLQEVQSELQRVKETVSKIEVEHGQKLNALFDGYKQNSQKLDRIEAEVKRHDEFIMKRIK